MNVKKKILSWYWKLRYKEHDVVWFDDLVDMETGEKGIKVYHRVDSVYEVNRGMDRLGIKTMTRLEAETIGGRPCEECFKKVLPTKEHKKNKKGGEKKMPEEKALEESEQYRQLEEISKIVNKEITKTLVWIALVMEENRSKTNLRTALDKATAILDYLNRLQDILKVELSLLTK